ncbi:hypothetical protein MKS88_002595 [Plasmodium brasilianum]|uniref:Uncharacterized protein n=1 Tax=Plasmodium brasilianum TaxID=5824 RepID=A0ACB9YAF9_PLABR|nr:hypothetical protein MKS88_002595 [Plasmodium brasilianum]
MENVGVEVRNEGEENITFQRTLKKSSNKKYNCYRKLDTIFYRLLVNHRQDKNRNLLYNGGVNMQTKENKSCIFETKNYFHVKPKILKEFDYMNFHKINITFRDKKYKKNNKQ